MMYDPVNVETSLATWTLFVNPPGWLRKMSNEAGSVLLKVQLKVIGCVGSMICPAEGDVISNAFMAANKVAMERSETRILTAIERVKDHETDRVFLYRW